MRLLLASASPRRAELLAAAGFAFDVDASAVDERVLDAEAPVPYARRIAGLKADAATARHPDRLILAADTIVVLAARIFGKPRDEAEAAEMLTALSGRTHDVLTAVVVRRGTDRADALATTSVTFAAMTAAEVQWHVASGEPHDKAGAYAIQGLAARFVERIEGSYSNVVGLPIELVYRLLRRFGEDDTSR